MLRKFKGISPDVDPKAHVFESADVIGMVKMKEFSSVWPNCTVRGDVNRIEIGRYSNIQDNSCLHVADRYACIVGDYVTVGHCATLHACTIEDHVLIGMGSVVLDGCVVGTGSVIAAGAVVTKGTIVEPYSLMAGIPAKCIKKLPEANMKTIGRLRHSAGRGRGVLSRRKDYGLMCPAVRNEGGFACADIIAGKTVPGRAHRLCSVKMFRRLCLRNYG